MKTENYFGPEIEGSGAPKYLTVIIYDISDNKQRLRMVKYLEGFGHRVQKSAFEAWLDNKKFSKLCAGMDHIVRTDDHVKIYRLKGAGDTLSWGDPPGAEPEDVIII